MAAIRRREGRAAYTDATHTRAIVEFHSDQNPNREVITLGTKASEDLGHLVGVSTHKGFDGASGSFTLQIKKPREMAKYNSLLRLWREPEGIWVNIYFIVEGQRFHVMQGITDTIDESMVRMEGGKRVEGYTVSGRDIGKVFEQTDLWLNPFDLGAPSLARLGQYFDMYATQAPQNGSPAAWIKFIVQSWLGNSGLAAQQWQLPTSLGSGSFFDLLDLRNLESVDNGKLANGAFWNVDTERGFGRLWDVMSEYSNDLLNELWVDLIGIGPRLRPGVVLRQRPFPTQQSGRAKWESIQKHVLERSDVWERHLAKGGSANRYNYWTILHAGHEITMDERAVAMSGNLDGAKLGQPGSCPIWNDESIAHYGLRRWEKSTIFLDGYVETGDTLWPQTLANWLRRVHDWYAPAPMQLSGTIVAPRMLPEVRIGTRLIERRVEGDVEFYCEAVDHSWTYPSRGSTTLTVTRGQYVDEDLLRIIYNQMENPRVLGLNDCSLDVPVEDAILQGCKFTPQSVESAGPRFLTHGGEGFDVYQAPDVATLERGGASLLSEGADPRADEAAPSARLVAPPDNEDAQAQEIAAGNPRPQITQPPKRFDEVALKRGEDPLAGYDTDDIDNDPIGGLDL